jgi:hypothetical protein
VTAPRQAQAAVSPAHGSQALTSAAAVSGYSFAMACPRCAVPDHLLASGWCRECELAFGIWSRRHASDIVSTVLAGMVAGIIGGIGLPLLGFGWLISAISVFLSLGAMFGVYTFHDRRRRHQFLESRLPRAYLPSKT